MKKIVIAIDGYSACGKSTTAREAARILGYRYIDSGAMYRAITLYFLEHHVALTNPREVSKAIDNIKISFQLNKTGASDTFLNGFNVEDQIREMRISDRVSEVSTIRDVRTALVEQQRKMGRHRGIVMDGRDIGSVVFPDAELKLFLTADIQVRAYRRQKELLNKGELIELGPIILNLQKRDQIDSARAESPLVQSPDAVPLDTTHLTIDEQVDEVIQMAIGKVISSQKSS